MLESDFWQDKANSKKVIKEKKLYEDLVNSFETSIEKLKDLDDLSKLALEENNEIIQNEILDNVKELRVWYTGVTRCKQNLHLLGTNHQYNFPLGKYFKLYEANYV